MELDSSYRRRLDIPDKNKASAKRENENLPDIAFVQTDLWDNELVRRVTDEATEVMSGDHIVMILCFIL